MNIVKIEAQRDFPMKDITGDNAAILELLMQNQDIVKGSHESAEAGNYLYRVGHASLLKAVAPQIHDTDRLAAFSHGITTYEAVGVMAKPYTDLESDTDLTLQIMSTQHALIHNLTGTLIDAREQFQDEQPRLARVVGASAARFYRDGTDYAIAGAAIARQLEVNARN